MQPPQTTDQPTALWGKETEHIHTQHNQIKVNRKDPKNIATKQGRNTTPTSNKSNEKQIKTAEHYVSLQAFI